MLNRQLGLSALVLVFAVSVAAAAAVQPGMALFYSDFSQDALGEMPGDWELMTGESNSVEIVADTGVSSKRAVHVRASEGGYRTRIVSPRWQAAGRNVSKIGIEYHIRMMPDSFTTNLYLLRSDSGSFLSVHHPSGNRAVTRGKPAGALEVDGWNRIRVLVDLPGNTYELYVNDMDNRVKIEKDKNENYREGQFDFRSPLEKWEDTDEFFIVIDQEGREGRPSEAYYSGFHVWVIE